MPKLKGRSRKNRIDSLQLVLPFPFPESWCTKVEPKPVDFTFDLPSHPFKNRRKF